MTDEQSAAARAFARQRTAMAIAGLTTPEKAVLLVLAIMANADGAAWPSITQLAARASTGRRTAFRALDRLAELELIHRAPIAGKGARYTFPLNWCQGGTSVAAAPVPDGHSTGARAAPKQPGTPKRGKATPSPSTRARSAAFNAVALADELPAGIDAAAWAGYVEMRIAMASGSKGRPWTAGAARAALRQLGKLASAGDDPTAVLERSVLHGWRGLFPSTRDREPGAVADDFPTVRAAERAMALIRSNEA